MEQIIIHVDMDAFYASVETRDDPSLRGKPLIIGSLPHERGVVATCSYEARKFGVHSGMNIKEAYRLCPHGIYRHPDFNKYRTVSRQLHEIWYSYATAAQAVSLDEAYLDVTEQAGNLEGARQIAMTIKKRTREEIGLTCSVGVGYSKTAAKTASEEKKPDGYYEIPDPESFVNLVIDRDVRVLYTIGEKTARKLNLAGIYTVRDIQNNGAKVKELLGKSGLWILQIASGIDNRKVTPYRPEDAKSIGREVTFQQDVNDYGYLKDVLLLLSLCVDHRARRVGLQGGGVTLKLTYADMTSITRSRLDDLCESAYQIYRIAADLLDKEEEQPVRLIGVSIYNLAQHRYRQLSLFDYEEDHLDVAQKEMEKLLDNLGRKYGLDFIGNLDKIYGSQVLYRTIEYMRKRSEN
ncbi:MAG: DNA polymerase IV [Erysipelotrichaceae bacterium]|nr:DNA polymerase IV [Erysipelotrichaceae bacterium]